MQEKVNLFESTYLSTYEPLPKYVKDIQLLTHGFAPVKKIKQNKEEDRERTED